MESTDKDNIQSSIDWEQRRYEIAKEMLSAIYVDEGNEARMRKGEGEIAFEYQDLESTAREAVRFADVLIKELQKQKDKNGRISKDNRM